MRAKQWLLKHRYFFIVFAFLAVYESAVVGLCGIWRAGSVAYAFHSVDLSMGFASYILPGGIFRALFPNGGVTAVSVYHTVLLFVFFAVLAAFSERLLLRADQKDRTACMALLALFLTGPCTFSIFVKNLGIQEVYWVYLAAVFFVCLAYRPLQPVIPVLCALALLVNYAAVICYVPFFCIMLLYKLSQEPSKRGKAVLAASFCASVCVGVGLFAYLVLAGSKNLKLSFEEFNAVLESRGVTNLYYIDSLLYGRYDQAVNEDVAALLAASPLYREGVSGGMQGLLNTLALRFAIVRSGFLSREPQKNILPFLALLPVVGVVFRFCFLQLRDRAAGKLRRFVFFCVPALFVFTLLGSWFVSFDYFKWMCYAYLPLFASFLYIAYHEKDRVFSYLRGVTAAVPFPAVLLYASLYGVLVLDAYY